MPDHNSPELVSHDETAWTTNLENVTPCPRCPAVGTCVACGTHYGVDGATGNVDNAAWTARAQHAVTEPDWAAIAKQASHPVVLDAPMLRDTLHLLMARVIELEQLLRRVRSHAKANQLSRRTLSRKLGTERMLPLELESDIDEALREKL
jgi:hypothetical protein